MKTYYKQKAPYKNGKVFWDTYLHYECKLIETSTKDPFNKEKDNEQRTDTKKSDRTNQRR